MAKSLGKLGINVLNSPMYITELALHTLPQGASTFEQCRRTLRSFEQIRLAGGENVDTFRQVLHRSAALLVQSFGQANGRRGVEADDSIGIYWDKM